MLSIMNNNIITWMNNLANIGIISLLVIFFTYLYLNHTYNYWSKKGIKSPPAIPFVGNLISFTTPLPLIHLEFMKKYGKFIGLYQGRSPVLSVADPAIIKRILVQDFNVFRNRNEQTVTHKIFSQNLVAVRDEKWKRIRSILSPMFTTSKLKKVEGLMSQCVLSLINALDTNAEKQKPFLLHDVMGNFTMDVISKCAFATETNAHSEKDNIFVSNARGFFTFNIFRAALLAILPKSLVRFLSRLRAPVIYVKEFDFFTDISFHLIDQRKKDPSKRIEDMLQLMIKAEDGAEERYEKEDMLDAHHVNVTQEEIEHEEKVLKDIIGSKYLDKEEIAAQTMIFFLAGYETTASTLTFCLYELSVNPDVQEKLYEEIKTIIDEGEEFNYSSLMKLPYLDAVVSETLRKHPPVTGLIREASEPYYIPEYNCTVEKKQTVFMPVYAIHHNPEYYKNPEKFDPERFMPQNRQSIIPYTYLPFGGGPRNCIGMRFALTEIKLGLSKIIQKFIIYKTEKTPESLVLAKSLFLLKTNPIYIGVKKRV